MINVELAYDLPAGPDLKKSDLEQILKLSKGIIDSRKNIQEKCVGVYVRTTMENYNEKCYR